MRCGRGCGRGKGRTSAVPETEQSQLLGQLRAREEWKPTIYCPALAVDEG